MGIKDAKILFLALLMMNVLVILVFRNWVLNNEAFVWILNGLPSWIDMEEFGLLFQNTALSVVKKLFFLVILTLIDLFFVGALVLFVKY